MFFVKAALSSDNIYRHYHSVSHNEYYEYGGLSDSEEGYSGSYSDDELYFPYPKETQAKANIEQTMDLHKTSTSELNKGYQ
jgi:hypothetical protein